MVVCDECNGWLNPALAADSAVRRGDEVLLIQRKFPPMQGAWAFPGGFVERGEDPQMAALRELEEETGVSRDLVRIEAENEGWLAYDLPLELLDKLWGGKYRGQEQKWFRMRFLGSDDQVNIETDHPEFAEWKWIDQSEMVDAIVPFKRDVYIAVLDQIGTLEHGKK